jgi:peroxiredoxin
VIATKRTRIAASTGLGAALLILLSVRARADDVQHAQLGARAPDFSLEDTEKVTYTLEQFRRQGRPVVLEWFDPDCPYVQKHHVRFDTWERLYTHYRDQQVAFLAINSTAAGQEGASLERNYEAKEDMKLQYPLLLDPTGAVGRSYNATNASQVAVIDGQGNLVYTGAVDDDPSPDRRGLVNYVALALDAILAGRQVATPTTRPYGCPIKY